MFGTYQLPPISGSEIFPKTIQPPTSTRIVIRDVLDIWEDYAQDMQAAAHRMVQQRIGLISGFLNGQRQNVQLGIVQQARNYLMLQHMDLEYTYTQGQEYLQISVDPLSELFGQLEPNMPCLLVLSAGNRISAIPMAKLREKPAVSVRLKKYSWAQEQMRTCQVKLNHKFSVALSPIKIAKSNRIEVKDNFVFTLVSDGLPLYKFEEGTGPTEAFDLPRFPIINGSDKSYYSYSDNFTIRDQRITSSDDIGYDRMQSAAASIDTEGHRYHGPQISDHVVSAVVSFWGLSGAHDTIQSIGQQGQLARQRLATAYAAGYSTYFKEDAMTYSGVVGYEEIIGFDFFGNPITEYHLHAGSSLDCPWMIYDNTGVVDTLNVEFLPTTFRGDLDQFGETASGTTTFLGKTFGGVDAERQSVVAFEFPYALGRDRGYITVPASGTISTPYGEFAAADGEYSFHPWLHVSNGKHVIQGFKIDDTTYLYLDESRYEPQVSGDIQTMFMDVPLWRVLELIGIPRNQGRK